MAGVGGAQRALGSVCTLSRAVAGLLAPARPAPLCFAAPRSAPFFLFSGGEPPPASVLRVRGACAKGEKQAVGLL